MLAGQGLGFRSDIKIDWSMSKKIQVLSVEAADSDALLAIRELRREGYTPSYLVVGDEMALEQALNRQPWDVVLVNHRLSNFNALGALALVKSKQLDIPFIVYSDGIGEEAAVQIVKAGAADYVKKGGSKQLVPTLERALQEVKLARERRLAMQALEASEARFKSLAANVPGVVFQLQRTPQGELAFIYVSDRVSGLCKKPPSLLLENAVEFIGLIHDDDLDSFCQAMEQSAQQLSVWNWEGRLLLDDQQQKWCNLRAYPRAVEGPAVLWEGIVFDITESRQREAELRHSQQRMRELAEHLETVREDERKRIAREVHDELGQLLTVQKMNLALLRTDYEGEPTQNFKSRIKVMEGVIDRAVDAVRTIATELRPAVLDLGLVAAIEWQLYEFTERTGILCKFVFNSEEIELADSQATAIFRIVQEALTNVARHSGAQRVNVELNDEEGGLRLKIVDSGCGIDMKKALDSRRFGLVGMRERADMLGGVFDIGNAADGGVSVTLHMPY